jgi:hypothetical protein
MVNWGSYLPGLGSDEPEDEEDAVTKTLRLLGQGAQAAQEAAGAAGYAVGQGIRGAGEAVSSAAGAVADAYAVPVEERPPQYSGPSYAQPTREEAGQEPIEVTEPLSRIGATLGEATEAGRRLLLRPSGLPGGHDPQTEEEARALLEGVPITTEIGRALNPGTQFGQYQEAQDAALGVVGRRAVEGAGGGTDPAFRYTVPESVPLVGGAEIAPSPQDLGALAAQVGLDPFNLVGTGPTARAGTAVARAAPSVVREGTEAAGRMVGRVTDELAAGARRADVLEASRAGQPSVTTPGVFGLSGLEPDLPAVQGMRPRIIPPDVADELDFPIRLPEDPATLRAIEAAGGTVDERGTTLNVIRMSDPEAAGGAATRSSVFYTAGPPGAPSEYARTGTVGPGGVGGQQRIEGPTRFRNPIFISDAPGEAAGFDDAMRQMTPSRLQAAQQSFDQATADWEAAMRSGAPNLKEVVDAAFAQRQQAYDRLAEARATTPAVATAEAVEQGIRAAKRAGPAGSPERAEALKTLVTRYGGDPDAIDDLMALRGAEMGESVYAVKENIVAGNARRAGHDGVITVQTDITDEGSTAYQDALEAAVEAHPQWQAQKAAVDAIGERIDAIWKDVPDGPRDFFSPESVARRDHYAALTEQAEAAQRKLENIHDRLIDEVDVPVPSRITELADPRELRNPTPGGVDEAALTAARQRAGDAFTELRAAESRWYDEGYDPSKTDAERAALRADVEQARAAMQAANAEVGAVMHAEPRPPGYTLRPDIPTRAQREAREAQRAARVAAARAVRQSPAVVEAQRAFSEAQAGYDAARAAWRRGVGGTEEIDAAGDAMDAAKRALDQATTTARVATAQASAGALPAQRGTDPFAVATRVVAEPLAGSIGGATIGGGLPAETDEERRANALRGAALGAVGFPVATRAARGAARLAGAGPSPGGGAAATLGGVPDAAARAPAPSTLGPVGQRVMDTYTALTPKRAEAVTARGIDVATAAIEKRTRPGAMPVPAAELVPQIHAAVVRNLDDTKVVMTGLNPGALRAFLRGEGLTSKAETGNLDLINEITTTQVNVAGGRQVLNEATGKMEKAPFTITEGADFAQRESEQMRAVTGGSRFPDPETGAIDTEAPKVLYAYVSEGQPLVAPNRPTLGLVWQPHTPRVSSVNHPFGLLSPKLAMHKAMAEGTQDLVYADDAVRGGRIAPATMEGGRLVEAAPGVPSSGSARFGWEQGGVDIGGGRTLVDTDYLVGPEGESSLRATSLVTGMSKEIQQAIARGQMTDPEQIAAVLMRGGSPQWKPGWGSVMNPTRTESLVLDPHLANVQAIYISGTPSNLAAMLEGAKTGGVGGGKGERLAELEMARRMRAAIKAETGNDVPIIFNDTSRQAASKAQLAEGASNAGWAPRLISDAQVLEGPPDWMSGERSLSPGRRRIVDQYTQATDPTTGEPYLNIGVTAGAAPRIPGAGALPTVNRALSEGLVGSVSGATTGAALPAETDEERRANALRGAALGAVGFPVATRAARGAARLAGAAPSPGGGTLATAGGLPGDGGAARAARRAARGPLPELPEGALPIRATPEAEVSRLRLDLFPPDVRADIQAAAEGVDYARTQRRGVLPDEAVSRLADDDAASVDQLIKGGKMGRAYNPEETVAIRNAVASQADVVRGLSTEIAEATTSGATPDLLIARRAAESTKLQALVQVAEGARAEAGRTLRQYAQQAKLIELDPNAAIARIRAKIADPDEFAAIVDEYTQAVNEGADPIVMAKLWSKVERGEIKAGDVFALYRRFNMLSGPRTFEVNALSGGLNLGYEMLGQAAGQGARGRGAEAAAELAAPFKAGARAFKNMAETMWHGVSAEQAARGDIPRNLSSRTDNPAAKAALTAMEIPDRLNAGVDQFFRTLTEDWAATILAHKQARAAGLSPRSPDWADTVTKNLEAIREDPSKFEQIKAMADRVTFSEEPGGLVRGLEDLKRRSPNIVGFVAPFIRTPANIASRAVDISPLGPVRTAVEAATGLGRGRANLSGRVRDNVIGTAATAWAYTQAQAGNLTGAGPDDPEKVAELRATGWQPYSIKIGDQYWSYANFAPFSLALSAGAAAAEAQKYAKPGKEGVLSMLADGAMRTGKVVTDMTVLAGLGAVIKAQQDPDRYGTQWLSTALTQLMPAGSFVNTIGQATDPLVRRSERTDVGTQVAQNLLARVPGLRETVPAAQDPLGRDIPSEQTGLRALNPFRPTTERDEPVLEAFLASGVDIGKPPEALTIEGLLPGLERPVLTAAEQRRWNQIRGEGLMRVVEPMLTSPNWAQATPEAKADFLEKKRAEAAAYAHRTLRTEIGDAELKRRIDARAAGSKAS